MGKHCKICSGSDSNIYCEIIKDNICQYCCDKYQLNRLTSDWEKYKKNNFTSDNNFWNEYNKCFLCDGLKRKKGQKLYLTKSFSLYKFIYKENYIFSNNIKEFNQKKIEYLKRIGCNTYHDYYHLGEAYYGLSLFNKSIKAFKKAESLSDKLDKDLYFYLGRSFFYNDSFDDAKFYLLKTIEIDKKFSQGYRVLADLFRKEQNYNKSIYFYNKSLKYFGQSEDGFFNQNYFGLAISYSKLELHKKVIQTSKKYLDNFGSWENQKELLLRHKNSEINYSNTEFNIFVLTNLFNLMSLSHLELDEIKKAEKYIRRAKILKNDDKDIIKTEGIIIGRKHNQKEIQEYKNTINKLKNNIENNLLINEMHSSIKKLEKEVDNKTILELKPNFFGIGLNLNNLFQKIKKEFID